MSTSEQEVANTVSSCQGGNLAELEARTQEAGLGTALESQVHHFGLTVLPQQHTHTKLTEGLQPGNFYSSTKGFGVDPKITQDI